MRDHARRTTSAACLWNGFRAQDGYMPPKEARIFLSTKSEKQTEVAWLWRHAYRCSMLSWARKLPLSMLGFVQIIPMKKNSRNPAHPDDLCDGILGRTLVTSLTLHGLSTNASSFECQLAQALTFSRHDKASSVKQPLRMIVLGC